MSGAPFCALVWLAAVAAPAQQSPFAAIPTAPPDALRFGAPLAAFEAKDIAGHTWRADDLRGKYTLIYIWSTFMARAADRLELHERATFRNWNIPDLPELQRFQNEVRNSARIQVLTFCTDYDYTHASEYMKGKPYTFPVIADWVLERKLFPNAWGPLVANPEGRVSDRFRQWSFGRVLLELERAAGEVTR